LKDSHVLYAFIGFGFSGATKTAWNGLDLPCDNRDRDLFAALTMVSIDDGKMAQFWSSSWANGRTLNSMAPTLFKKAKRKNLSPQSDAAK